MPEGDNHVGDDRPFLVGEREFIVILTKSASALLPTPGVHAIRDASSTPITRLLDRHDALLHPNFAPPPFEYGLAPPAGLELDASSPLGNVFRVDGPEDQWDKLANELVGLADVVAAYIKPPALPGTTINAMAPSGPPAPGTTPDYTGRQTYLSPSPAGIDAEYAWTLAGGRGHGVRIVDIEGDWRFTHEDYAIHNIRSVASAPLLWTNHGTAVVGVMGGHPNGLGVTGICPDAEIGVLSHLNGFTTSRAIFTASRSLTPGDILLIEAHRPGPTSHAPGTSQDGYIAIEWWEDDFLAIRDAANRGILVIEAAGNGGENLDDPRYDLPLPGFAPTWTNPFDRKNRDSGAIVAGAGAPPPGTHGVDWGIDRSRLDFSNYGEMIDAQGWGREVTTCGYGDLQGGADMDRWYTDRFAGTSSASPIVAGALACVQGVLKANGRPVLTPAAARHLLRSTGSPQQEATQFLATRRIGNRPNLRQLIADALHL